MTNDSTHVGFRPEIGSKQIDLLEKLCNASAVSGNENEVRQIVLEEVKSGVDEVKVDALGNVLVTRRGSAENRLRVMLAAHMDEVGFMLVDNDEGGLFRFTPVGGIDPRYLPGKPVLVGCDHLPGVIGIKPIHLLGHEERERNVSVDALRIDLGPEGGSKARSGDWAVFATRFTRLGPSLRARALDNRLGVATVIELLQHAPPNIDILAAFTVQEEIGLRGARVAGYSLNPDLAIVIDTTPAYDLPAWDGSENIAYNTCLGAGPAVYLADRSTLYDQRLVKHLVQTAAAEKIPYQFRQPGGGGTDAGAIHQERSGIPTISVSAPGRYLHTPAAILRLEDWQNMLYLLYASLLRITPGFLAS